MRYSPGVLRSLPCSDPYIFKSYEHVEDFLLESRPNGGIDHLGQFGKNCPKCDPVLYVHRFHTKTATPKIAGHQAP